MTQTTAVASWAALHLKTVYMCFWCSSPGSRTLLRSGSGLSSVTLGLWGSAPSRSLRASSGAWFSRSSLELPPLMNGPGRDDGGPEISGFSLRSLPELLRLVGGRCICEDVIEHGAASEGLVMIPLLPCCSLPSQSSPGVKVWVLWRCGRRLRRRRGLQRRVTIEASCPWQFCQGEESCKGHEFQKTTKNITSPKLRFTRNRSGGVMFHIMHCLRDNQVLVRSIGSRSLTWVTGLGSSTAALHPCDLSTGAQLDLLVHLWLQEDENKLQTLKRAEGKWGQLLICDAWGKTHRCTSL